MSVSVNRRKMKKMIIKIILVVFVAIDILSVKGKAENVKSSTSISSSKDEKDIYPYIRKIFIAQGNKTRYAAKWEDEKKDLKRQVLNITLNEPVAMGDLEIYLYFSKKMNTEIKPKIIVKFEKRRNKGDPC